MWYSVHSLDWWSVKINFGVDNQQWIAGIKNIIVDTHAVKILLEERLEEHILFFESCLLLFNSKLIEKDFVVSLVEVIKELELIVLGFLHAFNLLDVYVWNLFHLNFVTLIERKDLFLFGFKFSA